MTNDNYKLLIRNLKKGSNNELALQKDNNSVGRGKSSKKIQLSQESKPNNRDKQ